MNSYQQTDTHHTNPNWTNEYQNLINYLKRKFHLHVETTIIEIANKLAKLVRDNPTFSKFRQEYITQLATYYITFMIRALNRKLHHAIPILPDFDRPLKNPHITQIAINQFIKKENLSESDRILNFLNTIKNLIKDTKDKSTNPESFESIENEYFKLEFYCNQILTLMVNIAIMLHNQITDKI